MPLINIAPWCQTPWAQAPSLYQKQHSRWPVAMRTHPVNSLKTQKCWSSDSKVIWVLSEQARARTWASQMPTLSFNSLKTSFMSYALSHTFYYGNLEHIKSRKNEKPLHPWFSFSDYQLMPNLVCSSYPHTPFTSTMLANSRLSEGKSQAPRPFIHKYFNAYL